MPLMSLINDVFVLGLPAFFVEVLLSALLINGADKKWRLPLITWLVASLLVQVWVLAYTVICTISPKTQNVLSIDALWTIAAVRFVFFIVSFLITCDFCRRLNEQEGPTLPVFHKVVLETPKMSLQSWENQQMH
jgi:hypothetical protein